MRAILLVLLLAGCNATTFRGVCAFKHIGQNEAGVNFIQYQCEPTQEAK